MATKPDDVIPNQDEPYPPNLDRVELKTDTSKGAIPRLAKSTDPGLKLIQEDIEDFIDENPIVDLLDIDELTDCLNTIATLKSTFKQLHADLQADEDQKYQTILQTIKTYTKEGLAKKRTLKNAIAQTAQSAQIKSIEFSTKSIHQKLKLVESKTSLVPSSATDSELKNAQKGTSDISKSLECISKDLQPLIKEAFGTTKQSEVFGLQTRYEVSLTNLRILISLIDQEVSSRELEKHSKFKDSILKIKLPKFSGFESTIDIYTFQTEFEKIHLRDTPKVFLPDLLRNNYLEEPALSIVKSDTDIEEMWKRLKSSYGNTKILLNNKLSDLSKLDILSKIKSSSKAAEVISKVISTMKDLMLLSKKHKIEQKLYNGDGLQRIYLLMGTSITTRWLQSTCEEELEGDDLWNQLIKFLEVERKIQEQKQLIYKQEPQKPQQGPSKRESPSYHSENKDELVCHICGDHNHVATNGPNNTKLVQYFACPKFVEMSPLERFQKLRSKGLCYQCLYPGAQRKSGKHQDGQCQRVFICKHPYHDQFTTKMHVLVCDSHKDDQQNRDLLEHYKSKCITRQRQLPSFSKEINLSHLAIEEHPPIKDEANTIEESNPTIKAIYMLQTIEVGGKEYTIFYDTGCANFITRYQATQSLGARAVQKYSGQVSMGGVGGITSHTDHGIYKIVLPLANNQETEMVGVCMDRITATFPFYPLQGKVERDIKHYYQQQGGDPMELPNLPKRVGGDVDFMIGIRHLSNFPEKIFELPSGLTIYKSKFRSVDGSQGVIGGPHEVFGRVHAFHSFQSSHFIDSQLKIYRQGYNVNPDLGLLGYEDIKRDYDQFTQVELAGSEISFRCVKCRNCTICKEHSTEDAMSIREEVEQDLIDRSVKVNINECITTATLPLLQNPETALAPNRNIALRVYNQQVKRLAKNQQDKDDIIKSESKLQSLGYVEYVKNLPTDQRKMLQSSPIQNFIPWRAVWKPSSISTPCRVVYDASMPTESGKSLNDILPKGRNGMNKLLEIFLRWRGHRFAYHTDIQKMYNTIKLDQSHWCLQRYLWHESLDPDASPDEKIIKTLIYGVKSSGNQAEFGLRETAKIFRDQHPDVYRTVSKDIYVDDCLSGHSTLEQVQEISNELEVVISHGGFALKGFTISGSHPNENLSSDGETISVAGMTWRPQEDSIALDIKDLNFAKRYRGKKVGVIKEVPANLTRRQCVSKASEVFDLSGIVTPITASLKLDLHDLINRKLSWDDTLPENLRQLWISNFELISEIKNITYRRAIVPEDAESLHVNTLDFGDASESIACSAIYIRFRRTNGSYSCQLLFSRSRILPDDMTQPRGELVAALLNAHTGEVVRKAFSTQHDGSHKFTDSQIVLHWICNENRPLKKWLRSRVIEIKRFSPSTIWSYIKSSDMIADIATRRCDSTEVIKPNSSWINGYPWMTTDEFPNLTANEISLSQKEQQEVAKEINKTDETSHFTKSDVDKITKFYKFSDYLIDPLRHTFSMVCRTLSLVIKFIQNCKNSINKRRNQISNEKDPMESATQYFYKKATQEVKEFMQPSRYQNISKLVNNTLIYTGRILPDDSITIAGKATKAMIDLSSTTFAVPIVCQYSPIAISIINEIHWYHPTARHSGIETTYRYLLQQIYVIDGRSLVKSVRRFCERCRYLLKKTMDVEMGPISPHNLMIAPAFYSTQLDLCGPFTAYPPHHKRKTIKVWMVVFCCATTTTVSIKLMDDYSSTAFIEAFIRFSCEVGYPQYIHIDEGSQLLKGCEGLRFDFTDAQWKLFTNYAVEFDVCPVGGHNMNGRVERKIREIRRSMDTHVANHRLSLMQLETLASQISNNINNLPIAIRGIKGDFESVDLLTPNRLRLGRNNDRSPTGSFSTTFNDRILDQNQAIFNAWFETWLTSHVPQLMTTPKWFKSDQHIKKGDVILFTKQESKLSSSYQFGMVESIETGRDGRIRKCHVRYRNANEKVDRVTFRAVRSLVVIHHVDEIDLMHELYKAR